MNSDPCQQALAQIEHIALATSDLERLCDFYRQLGASASPTSTAPDTGLRTCVLDFCGIRLEVFEREGSSEGEAGGDRSPRLLHLGFALACADAVDELTRVLAAAGHRVLEPPHRAGELGRYESVVLDPDGNRLKLTV
ncbi:MAG TPA: VOC family protein [Gaiellaceae bacterium]|nr:VOC family protein [Gaiellaceae bacterium]